MRQKRNSGITLVALVVTIVVLLILAGVSINMVLGNNGLIAKVKEARNKTEQDQINTELALNNLYGEIMETTGQLESELNIGDYVNYTYPVANGYDLLSTQSGYGSDQTVAQSATTLKWRILNISNGTIDLVSAEPTSNTVTFSNSLGYNNGVYLLNDMCEKLYSNSTLGITARSINLGDMEKHLTTPGFEARNAYKWTYEGYVSPQYGHTERYESNKYYPKLYANQPGAGIDLATGTDVTQPADYESKVDPYNESANVYTAATTDTHDPASTSLTVTQTHYNIPIIETNYGPAADVLKNNNYFWVASRDANCRSTYASFGLRIAGTGMGGSGMFHSTGTPRPDNYRLRPVVSLPSSLLDGTKDASGAWNLRVAE